MAITIANIEQYTQRIINGDLVLTRNSCISVTNVHAISAPLEELLEQDLSTSKIIECKINNQVMPNIKNYYKLLHDLYSRTPRLSIIQNSKMKLTVNCYEKLGYKYYEHLQLSIQGADTKKVLQDIIIFSRILNLDLELKIRLKNNEVVIFTAPASRANT